MNWDLIAMYLFGLSPIIAIFAAIYGFFGLIAKTRKAKNLVKEIDNSWVSVTAQITEISLTEQTAEKDDLPKYIPSIKYTYRYISQTFEGEKLAWFEPSTGYYGGLIKPVVDQLGVNSQIKVYCNPNKPSQACLIPYLDFDNSHRISAH